MARTYWLDLFTVETWQEFLDHGADVSGFNERRWAMVQKMQPGDYLLCYLVRASRWVGVLEVTGRPFQDSTPIWKSQVFPSRVPVKVVVSLAPETGVPVLTMRDQLTVFQGISNPNNWSGPFRGSPARWKASDGEVVLAAIKAAADNPVERPLGRLRARPKDQPVKVVATEEGTLTVPDEEAEPASSQERGTRHTEIQFLLLQLGSDMGFDVYVARNDQTKEWQANGSLTYPDAVHPCHSNSTT